MLGFLRKQSERDLEDQKKSDCSSDPDCPMCQVSDEVMGVLEENNRGLKRTDPKKGPSLSQKEVANE